MASSRAVKCVALLVKARATYPRPDRELLASAAAADQKALAGARREILVGTRLWQLQPVGPWTSGPGPSPDHDPASPG